MRREKNGFTLVELLVVISIIAILLAVLMPALSKAKMNAKMVICATHQKSILTAVTCYTAEYSGKIPVSNQGYVRSIADKSVMHWTFPIRLKYYYGWARALNSGSVMDILGTYMKDPANWSCPLSNQDVEWQKKYFENLKDAKVRMMDCSYMLYWNYLGYYKEQKLSDGTAVSGITPFGFNPVAGRDTLMITDIFLPTDSYNSSGKSGERTSLGLDYMSSHPFKRSSLFKILNSEDLSEATEITAVKVFMGDTGSKVPQVKLNAGYLDGHIEKFDTVTDAVTSGRAVLPKKWR